VAVERDADVGVAFTLLTKLNCPLCDHAREVLDRVGVDYLVNTEVVWLETPEGEEFATTQHTPFPPVLLIDGELHGFGRLSEKKLRRELDRMDAPRRSWWDRLRRLATPSARR